MSHWKRIINEDKHGLFRFSNTKMPKNTKIFIWQPRWNMISPVIFAGALTFLLGPCPRGPHFGDEKLLKQSGFLVRSVADANAILF